VDNDKINITGKNQESPYNTTTVYEQLQWPHVVVPKTLFVIIMEMSCKLRTRGTKWIEIHQSGLRFISLEVGQTVT
jgi:hypothetical protein